MKKLMALVVLLWTAAGCVSCEGSGGTRAPTGTLTLHTSDGPVTLSVEIADTPDERAQGLMGRTSLPADRGMAFVFTGLSDEPFWMKDTEIPLSIAFWDATDRVVALREMAPCREDPCPTYHAGVPYVGAVEANRGFFTEHGVAVGDRVELVTTADG